MNNQESKDFDFQHNYNKNMIEQVAQHSIRLWNKAGRPMDKELDKTKYPELFHWNIFVAGMIERIKLILQGKDLDKK